MKCIALAVAAVVIILVSLRLRSGNADEPARPSSDLTRPLLRQFGDLRERDFQQHAVWVHCHVIDHGEPWYDDTDEETFRPWDGALPVHPDEAMFLVRATLVLADGSEIPGFVTPQDSSDPEDDPDLGCMQPQAFPTSGAPFGFWYGILVPSDEAISGFYAALGKSPQQIFPVEIRVGEGLATGITSALIPGFCSMSAGREITVRK